MSEAEEFWRGPFGDDYSQRNSSPLLVEAKTWMLDWALACVSRPQRVIEFGANIGLNLDALEQIPRFTDCQFAAVELNAGACEVLRRAPHRNVFQTSMLNPDRPWGRGYDLAFTCGVLIHIPPENLPAAYETLLSASKRYILTAEYHNPTPVEVLYRGNTAKLWKRDFAADLLDAWPRLRVVDYGFVWRRDPKHPGLLDDLVWTLMEKTSD